MSNHVEQFINNITKFLRTNNKIFVISDAKMPAVSDVDIVSLRPECSEHPLGKVVIVKGRESFGVNPDKVTFNVNGSNDFSD